jgi:protein-arginine deiminase
MRRVSVLSLALLAAACSASDTTNGPGITEPTPTPAVTPVGKLADLRADSNRDGEIRFDDETDSDKTTWDAKQGAVFLANIDDDKARCAKTGTDVEMFKCNDAADEVIDGTDDILDLARLKTKPWAEAPENAWATVSVTPSAKDHVRLFKRTGPGDADFTVLGADGALTVDDVRAGIELAIEGKDIVRDKAVWDGFVDVTLTIETDAETLTDSVKMRVAPVMTFHHLLPAEEAFVTNTGYSGNADMRSDLAVACTEASLPKATEVNVDDQWTQDFFETAFMSMPGPGGTQHVMHVNLRSANVYEASDAKNPLRPAGQVVFTKFRGKDVAGVQQYDKAHDGSMDSLNSFGNLETIPPYELAGKSYPFGRILRGSTATFYPDKTFTKMLDGQGVQPQINVDTSWLYVGHVDETISFVKASSPRGWVMLVNDPTIAKKMLEDQVAAGNGATPMFVGESWYDDMGKASPAVITIAQVLADTTVMSASAEAATEVAGQIEKIKTETGLTDAEIIKVPFLHTSTDGGSIAYIPGMVNGVYVGDAHFVAPKPHGPVINGKDIFEQTMIDRLKPLGITVHFAEDWDEYHAALGEVHCGTNTRRKIPDTKWWESGR